jgi:hypothetical protein
MKNTIGLNFLFLLIVCCKVSLCAQILPKSVYDERLSDAYKPQLNRQTNNANSFNDALITTIQVNTDSTGQNILNDAANEPSIAIDPTNPLRMVIGWRQFDNIESSFRQAGNAYTLDGGITWTNLEPIEKGIFRSDPVLDSDNKGNFYYNSLNVSDFTCQIFKSNDPSKWEKKVEAYGGDKQWMAVDKTNTLSDGNVYENWASNSTICGISRSVNYGESFDTCYSIPINPGRGSIEVGPSGNVYFFGSYGNAHYLLLMDSIQFATSNSVNNKLYTVELKGVIGAYQGPNPDGFLGQAWVKSHTSKVDDSELIYVLNTVSRIDINDNADVMFAKSRDGGKSWTEAIRIHKDTAETNWNWFGTMSVAPNGRIDVVWLDTRDTPGKFLSALYYSYSLDEGESWSEDQKMSGIFDPHIGWPNQRKMGDYFHMISDNNGAHLAWAGTFTGGQDVYYSYIKPQLEVKTKEHTLTPEFTLYPNPASDNFAIDLKKISTITSLKVVNVFGQVVYRLSTILQNKISINPKELPMMSPGVYFVSIENGNQIHTKKLILR